MSRVPPLGGAATSGDIKKRQDSAPITRPYDALEPNSPKLFDIKYDPHSSITQELS
jgi:hypothetical protein